MADFKLAIDVILKNEGGFVDDPDDSGGETKFGISKKAYPSLNIKELTIEQAKEIYFRDYWQPVKATEIISQEVATALFDAAVNMGVGQAARLIQRAASVPDDGKIGTATLAAVNKMSSKELLPRFTLEKVKFYVSICNRDKSQNKFLLGWLNRAIK